VPAEYTYDYAVIRVMPRVDRGEVINVGVILNCPEVDFLDVRIDVDESRLRMLDASVDIDVVRAQLAAFEAICRGGDGAGAIGEMPLRNRYYWLVAVRSTIIQVSSPHTGRTTDPVRTLDHLFDVMVRPSRPARVI
jgi:hypothetical protein